MEGKRQGRNKVLPTNALCIGGEGGIAGLFVFGGALAIAGFMAVASFASNKQKAKATHDQQTKPKPQQLLLDEHECKSEDDHDTTQSLTSLVKNSSIGNRDATWYATSTYTIYLLGARTSLLIYVSVFFLLSDSDASLTSVCMLLLAAIGHPIRTSTK